jgi:hemoglobin/transferrin/lactoferrin receptor protein
MIKRILLPVFLAITGNPLSAVEIDTTQVRDTMRSYTIDEVVITASRNRSMSLKTPEPIRMIDKGLFGKYQIRTAPEALQLTPAVFTQKTNHGGGSPIIRGLTGNQTLLLIDGIRLNNATYRYGPNQYLNTVDIFSSERIEVLRGSGSVQYGSDALGGTIQLFSRDISTSIEPLWQGSLLTRLATQGMEQSLRGNVMYNNSKSAFAAGITARNFGDIVGGDTTGRQTPTGYKELDFDLKGKVKLSQNTEIIMAFQQVHQYEVPVYHKIKLENYAVNMMDPQKRQLGYVKLNRKINSGILRSINFTTSYQHTEEGRKSQKNSSDVLRYENDKVRSLGFIAEAITSSSDGWSASNGIEVYNDMVGSSRTDINLSTGAETEGRGLYPDGSTMTSIAVYSLHTLELKGWLFNAGARFNTFAINVEDETIGQAKMTPSAIVGNVAVLRKLTAHSNLFISASTGFRAPNIDDMGTLGIVDFRYEIPNYDLKPEKSFQYQAGYKYQGSRLSGEIYLYRNELKDLIVRTAVPGDTIEGYPVYIKENVERAFIQGLETNLGFELSRSWLFRGTLTYTYGQNITKNEPMRRIPPLFGCLSLEYGNKRWWGSLEWLAASKQDRLAAGDKSDNRIPEGGTPGWNILNLNGSFQLKHIKFEIGIGNIFNKDYRYHGSGINGYGRHGIISVALNI